MATTNIYNKQQFCGLKTWSRCRGSVVACPALSNLSYYIAHHFDDQFSETFSARHAASRVNSTAISRGGKGEDEAAPPNAVSSVVHGGVRLRAPSDFHGQLGMSPPTLIAGVQ